MTDDTATGQSSGYDSTRYTTHRGYQLPGEELDPLLDEAVDPRRFLPNTIDHVEWRDDVAVAVVDGGGTIEGP